MSDVARVTSIERMGKTTFRGAFEDGWQQGKGAFGGIVVGMLTRALLASEEDPKRTLRSLSAELCAPAMPGPASLEVSLLRRGGNVSFHEVRLVQEGALVAHATAALASARPVAPTNIVYATPPRPPWNDVPVVPVAPPLGPVFGQHYEYRSSGPPPFAGGREAIAEGYVREKKPPTVLDEAAIMGLLDAWWPTSFALATGPRACATVGYTMQLLVDPRTLPASEPLFYRGRGVTSADNFFVEMRELWSGDRVVALNQQTFAVLA